jgi:hypothetical protein
MAIRQIAASKEQTGTFMHLRQQGPGLEAIIEMLTVLAEARQASISAETLKVYSSRIGAYPLDDVRSAVNRLSLVKRAEGETAFPDLATLDEAVRGEGRDRRIAEAKRRKRTEEEAYERNLRDHPEDFVSMADIVGDFYKTKGMDAEKKGA